MFEAMTQSHDSGCIKVGALRVAEEHKAIIAYRHEDEGPEDASEPKFRAVAQIGNRADLPAFKVRYADDYSWFDVSPLNDRAREFVGWPCRLTEAEWAAVCRVICGLPVQGHFFPLSN
jgi:hypothetical protein